MKTKNIGSSFDDFLLEEGMLEESAAIATKRLIAWKGAQERKNPTTKASFTGKKAGNELFRALTSPFPLKIYI